MIFSNYEDVKGEEYTGFTKHKPLNRAPYKFILIGENDREIWLNPIFEGKTELVDEPKVRTIMEALGYDLGSPLHPKIEWIKKNILSIKPINTAIRFDNE
ncbi:hypothetical protein COF64_22720 [Bacillus sp. AFS043905]|nr:hypothetical protein COF64_22720 [Bacillus sp. AFS043905]